MELLGKNKERGKNHVPVIEKAENKIKVKAGSILHLMEENPYIQWFENIKNNVI